jgi:hypothetical protein
MTPPTLTQVLDLATQLPPVDKLRLIEHLAPQVAEAIPLRSMPRRDLYGILADLKPAPSAEDIDETRRENWRTFPREDI